MTAPNSLNPRANINIRPDNIFLHARGSDIVKNTRIGDAPKFKAVFSSFTGTFEKPSREAFIRNGMLTNDIANPIPIGCPTKFRPTIEAACPIAVSLDMNPRIAIPAAEWGIMIGRSIMPLTSFLKGKVFLARIYDKGIAPIEKNKVNTTETQIVSHILPKTSFSLAVSKSCAGVVARNMFTRGATINSNTSPPSIEKINDVPCGFFIYSDLKNTGFIVSMTKA